MELKTPLYDCHVSAGGKIVPFASYLLPVQYTEGVIAEHMAVRTKAGLFDVSHMGEVIFSGKDALANINMLFTNDFTNLSIGKVRYSPMCNETGGVVDDLIVYRTAEQEYFVVVNAANREKDVAWMKSHLFGDVTFKDISENIAQLALQGPESHAILKNLADEADIPEQYYSFCDNKSVAGVNCLISCTGYTGESGYELYCKPEDAVHLWNSILAAGKENGLIPCGLGARDTLRLEASMPLYGHEMDETITPLETGLSFAVKMKKESFIGKEALEQAGTPKRKRVGLQMTGRGIAREQCTVYYQEKQIGLTTSGTHLPYLNGAYAMALIDAEYTALTEELLVDVRGRKIPAVITALPFYKKA